MRLSANVEDELVLGLLRPVNDFKAIAFYVLKSLTDARYRTDSLDL